MTDRHKVAVLGLGGVGGMIAARTGALCVGTPRTVEAIRDHGLTLVDPARTTVTHPTAVERLEEPVSLLVVAVKAFDLLAALERIAPEAVADAVVLPLLNGLEHLEVIRAELGAVVAAGSISRFEAFSQGPARLVQRTPGAMLSCACAALDEPELVAAVVPLRVATIEIVVRSHEQEVLWEKAARLGVLAAATAASGKPIGPLRSDPVWRARLDDGLREACAVAHAEGVMVEPADQWAIIDAMPATLTTSTARDVAAGRPSELDAISGSVVRAGRRLGVATAEIERLLLEATERS